MHALLALKVWKFEGKTDIQNVSSPIRSDGSSL